MVKHFYKRVIAGILSVLTAVTMVPVAVLADETPTDITSLFTGDETEIQEIMEALQYLETFGSDYSLPAIMISEGDSVYDDEDYLIASTIVPITKDVVNDQTKIKTQYWCSLPHKTQKNDKQNAKTPP